MGYVGIEIMMLIQHTVSAFVATSVQFLQYVLICGSWWVEWCFFLVSDSASLAVKRVLLRFCSVL